MTKIFDPACLALAEYFCSDHPHTTPDQLNDLAYTIQTAIEDWMEEQDNAAEARNDPSNRRDQ